MDHDNAQWWTTIECRGCGRQELHVPCGKTPFEWSRLEGIDGPDSICPACIHDLLDDVLARLREDGYSNPRLAIVPAQNTD